MRSSTRGGDRHTPGQSARNYGVAVLLALGVAVAGGHGTAWADSTGTDSPGGSPTSSESASESASAGLGSAGGHKTAAGAGGRGSQASDFSPVNDAGATKTRADESTTAVGAGGATAARDTATSARGTTQARPGSLAKLATAAVTEKSTAVAEQESTSTTKTDPTSDPQVAGIQAATLRSTALPAPSRASAATTSSPALPVDPKPATLVLEPALAPVTVNTALLPAVPDPLGPVSPIVDIVDVPGRLINAVLQLAGFTTAGNPVGPISPAPISELVFAVFRRLESDLGLDAPVSLPVPPSLTYTGPLTTPTPTVAQFLNAATAEYVLGGVPAGMRPFTVDGWPMTSTKEATGMTAQVWVTPQSQIIIAYSGTTGGSNLLFNPLIAISQIITDAQGSFSSDTPQAFLQALNFAQSVKTEAAKQGYAPENIFVTGHSLGAWEAQYVAQQIGLNGIGFEGPGLSSTVPGNGVDSLFVNTATYGDIAAYMASDLPGLQPFAPPYVPAGGLKPHYGPIVLLGDPTFNTPMANASALFGTSLVGSLIAVIDLFGNFLASHLPGIQAYNLDVAPNPGIVPWLGIPGGPVLTGFGELTIPEFLKAASDAGILVVP